MKSQYLQLASVSKNFVLYVMRCAAMCRLRHKTRTISRVSCPKCGERSAFKSSALRPMKVRSVTAAKAGAPYDRTRTYRTGQAMMHPTFGLGEVTKVIEPCKIDVLFADRMRRLIHSLPASE